MNNLAAENDGELPEEMAEVLSVYSELKVSKRKANTKALNRAKKADVYKRQPQRRKRIYLVADFGGNTAPKILFEREGLSGNFAESREEMCIRDRYRSVPTRKKQSGKNGRRK